MLNNPSILRTRTSLTSSGTRVNWKNTSYFEIKEGDGVYIIGIKWKYKASIKTETVEINIETDLYKYFKQFGLVQINPTIFINLNNILTIDEEQIHGPVEKTRIRFVFWDGFEITIVLQSTTWVWWKTTYM